MGEQARQAYGIDIGGTGIKGAIVDTSTGQLVTARKRILTPQPATPDAVAAVVAELLADAKWQGLVGRDVSRRHQARRGQVGGERRQELDRDGRRRLLHGGRQAMTTRSSCSTTPTPPASPKRASARPRACAGVVILLTFGTGIGSALLIDGTLVPNTELGHLELDGHDAEKRAAASVRDEERMSYKRWAKRVQEYMSHVERLFTPDLFVVGGGVSKDADKWVPLLELNTPVKPAELLNDAGIVGAAMAAAERYEE